MCPALSEIRHCKRAKHQVYLSRINEFSGEESTPLTEGGTVTLKVGELKIYMGVRADNGTQGPRAMLELQDLMTLLDV